MQTRHTRMLPFSRSVMSDSLQPRGRQPARLLCPWGSPGKNTGVGDLVDCSPPGSSVHVILQSRILEWVAISYSRGSY